MSSWVWSNEDAQGNAFGRVGSGPMGSLEETRSGRLGRVSSCEGAQVNMFGLTGLVWVGSCEGARPKKHIHVGWVMSCEGT